MHTLRALRWLRVRWPELLVVALGVLLRMTMTISYDVRSGYDFSDHWAYVAWFADHWTLPALDVSREAYHPPLYHFLTARAYRAGLPLDHVNLLSILCGSLRLLVIWLGLERCLPERRAARLVALGLASILPASILTDGMVSNECLSALLSTVAILLMVELLLSVGRRRWTLAVALGLTLGLDLLTKISGLVLIGAGVVIALVELCSCGTGGRHGRVQRLLSWAAALALVVVVSGWYFAHNYRTHGKVVLSGFDGLDAHWYDPVADKPYFERRDARFFFGWTSDIVETPYYPTGVMPVSYLWPPLIASTFVDYYNYGFAGATPPVETYNGRPVSARAAMLSSFAMVAGIWIALVTVVAWLAALVSAWRKRSTTHLLLLLLPLLALLGQIHFAVKFAVDIQGPIKGSYLLFASAPLFGLFGLAATWGWKRGWPQKIAIALHAAALALVAIYCLYARLG